MSNNAPNSPSFDPRFTAKPDNGSLSLLRRKLQASGYQGDLYNDPAHRVIYATDNSVYQVSPVAVTVPMSGDDVTIGHR